jgi:hypothetical protein
MNHAAPNPPPTLWSSLVAAAHRDARRDAVAWLLEAGEPQVVTPPLPLAPEQALCRRCIATSRPARRGVLVRWHRPPPPFVVAALTAAMTRDVRSGAPTRQGAGDP